MNILSDSIVPEKKTAVNLTRWSVYIVLRIHADYVLRITLLVRLQLRIRSTVLIPIWLDCLKDPLLYYLCVPRHGWRVSCVEMWLIRDEELYRVTRKWGWMTGLSSWHSLARAHGLGTFNSHACLVPIELSVSSSWYMSSWLLEYWGKVAAIADLLWTSAMPSSVRILRAFQSLQETEVELLEGPSRV